MLKVKLSELVQQRIEEIQSKNKQIEENKVSAKQKDNIIQQREQTIVELQEEITLKDNRNAQLHELFQGTAKIFSKQHNYVDKLKKDLETEIKDKNTSQEKAKHLQEDINRLDKEKQELDKRVKELEDTEGEIQKARDKELQELKERVIKLNTDLEAIIQSDKLVFDLLGQFSDKDNLYLRAKEIIDNLKIIGKEAFEAPNYTTVDEKELKRKIDNIKAISSARFSLARNIFTLLDEYRKEKFWWDKWINDRDSRNIWVKYDSDGNNYFHYYNYNAEKDLFYHHSSNEWYLQFKGKKVISSDLPSGVEGKKGIWILSKSYKQQ